MKHSPSRLLLTGLLATVGFTAMAQTPPTAPAAAAQPGQMAPAGRGEHGRFDPARFQEHMARRMADMKQKLQITPAQEGAWTAYANAMKPPATWMANRGKRAEIEKLPTPERIDRMRALRTERNSEMDKRADATKAFYATLTPYQKGLFDATSQRRGGRGGHHGERRHHG